MMRLRIIMPGVQTTVQGAPRRGYRHQGVPGAGAADGLSLALTNLSLGNPPDAPGLEISFGGLEAEVLVPGAVAVGGAVAPVTAADEPVLPYAPVVLSAGQRLVIGPVRTGCRVYLAVPGGVAADMFLGSPSTYLPAGFGGHQGRALRAGDDISAAAPVPPRPGVDIPPSRRPVLSRSWVLRAGIGPEAAAMPAKAREALFASAFRVSRRLDRMGAALEGKIGTVGALPRAMDSVPVFPGTVQLPPDGAPYLLMADAQTTGGYPRMAQVIRADRHRMGQLCPGDMLTFRQVTRGEAASALDEKVRSLADLMAAIPGA